MNETNQTAMALARAPRAPQITDERVAGLSVLELGRMLSGSGYFADAKEAAQAAVKVLAGRELGIGPVASMTGIYIVKGRVTLSANLIGAAIKRSGKYNYRVRRMDDTGCSIEFFEGAESIGTSEFTKADAQKASLTGDTWTKFARNMLFARAMSNGAKWFCPDVFNGPVYTPDELGAQIAVSDDGEMKVINEHPSAQVAPARVENEDLNKRARGLVSRSRITRLGDKFIVGSDSLETPSDKFEVWRDDRGKVRCTCTEFVESVDNAPAYRCVHIIAIKFFLLEEQPAETQAQAEAESPAATPLALSEEERERRVHIHLIEEYFKEMDWDANDQARYLEQKNGGVALKDSSLDHLLALSDDLGIGNAQTAKGGAK